MTGWAATCPRFTNCTVSSTHYYKMKNIVLFGKPGAGKGTQAEFLKTRYNFTHISTGDVFRFNLKNDTPLGREARTFMDAGQLVPDALTIKMLQDEVEKHPGTAGFLFDGFPRTVAQAEALDAFLISKGWQVNAVVGLEADDNILVERLLERGKTSGRADDQDEALIRKRYQEYNEKTEPLIEFYSKQGKYYAVDGIGSISDITERLGLVIDKL
jgi:adenylate kinase